MHGNAVPDHARLPPAGRKVTDAAVHLLRVGATTDVTPAICEASFDVALSSSDPAPVLRLRGELDMASAGLLSRAAAGLAADHPRPAIPGRTVELDLTALTFLDTSGLAGLTDAATSWARAGWQAQLTQARPPVELVLRFAGAAGWISRDLWEDPTAAAAASETHDPERPPGVMRQPLPG